MTSCCRHFGVYGFAAGKSDHVPNFAGQNQPQSCALLECLEQGAGVHIPRHVLNVSFAMYHVLAPMLLGRSRLEAERLAQGLQGVMRCKHLHDCAKSGIRSVVQSAGSNP